MAFNTSAASTYVENNSTAIVTKAVAGAKTAQLLIDNNAVQTGVKGQAPILKMDADVNLQDGASCGRTSLGTTTLSDKFITVKPLADMQDFCPKALYNKYYSVLIAKGQKPEDETLDSAFVQQIMDVRAAKIANLVDKLLWQGDTSLTTSMKWIDGILKQVSGASDKIALTETGDDIVEKLQSIYEQMPAEITSQDDFRIFIGEDLFKAYTIKAANKNYFNPVDAMTVYGTTAKLEVIPGLNGTNKIVAGKISDFQLGLDKTDDADKAVLRLSAETNKWYMDFYFSVGVAAVYTSQIGYLALA